MSVSRYEGVPVPCPHCPDGHQRPDWGRWAVYVAPGRDGDGQPTTLHVSRPDGAHVAEADAEWARGRLNTDPVDFSRFYLVGGDLTGHQLCCLDCDEDDVLPWLTEDPTLDLGEMVAMARKHRAERHGEAAGV